MPMPPDAAPVNALPNLGPTSQRWLAEIEVATVGDLRALGAVEAYARLRFVVDRQVTRTALHALDAALRGIDWRRLDPAVKRALEAAAERRLAGRSIGDPTIGTEP